MKKEGNFSISKTIKGKLESLPFEKIKIYVLGKNYELSLVFIGSKKSKSLNKKYRDKNKSANTLAFPLSKSNGEIFICPETASRDAIKFKMRKNQFIIHLFAHGLLHLKGFTHGEKMEKEEEKIKLKFKI
ncbi:MAG: rRNA maturation RNase YbeY [Candidatus Zambryskibacteria bacterium RIFCSPHIGHO2_12_FULL_38_37]|uniref:Endoribonuclease YbeY n=2 Tax=Parcubacteria group TaxID=1794811 RepID=A0A1F5EID1_9BACT|nr:MAG: rRNA maturation RNase YbeY [Candidatus Campbellbacteria bacterium RIFCSPLOWO2_02_35_12]OHA95441.1 MAG: rRNA maturation RNase YbeY [Candidatus Zambryskibacteria bacterium RIFCSPHIGHO2_02_FULL_39_82]OHA98134.1 MAG: rRNA maturation RNase YbeY [Candidatus Zambryskibacteria bacterium RIFCSPHIGHO2_12_FULL_38_37]